MPVSTSIAVRPLVVRHASANIHTAGAMKRGKLDWVSFLREAVSMRRPKEG